MLFLVLFEPVPASTSARPFGDALAARDELALLGVRQRGHLAGGAAGHEARDAARNLRLEVLLERNEIDLGAVGGKRGHQRRVCAGKAELCHGGASFPAFRGAAQPSDAAFAPALRAQRSLCHDFREDGGVRKAVAI